ncbi:MAG: hypothetical protein ACOC3X_00415 [Nanoarchaeota archaeon]
MEKVENNSFFVSINNYNEIKKEIFKTSNEILVCLKNFEKIQNIRANKNKLIRNYLEKISEIKNLSSLLNEKLPQIDSKKNLKLSKEKNSVKKEKISKADNIVSDEIDVEKIEDTDIKNIEKSIDELEKKINNIVN